MLATAYFGQVPRETCDGPKKVDQQWGTCQCGKPAKYGSRYRLFADAPRSGKIALCLSRWLFI